MKADMHEALHVLQQRCKTQGLVLTPPRNAILSALLDQSACRDAVSLLQAAQVYYSATSIGTVYRFLRELDQRGLIDAFAQPHGRTRWQLRQPALPQTGASATDMHQMVAQVQDFLRTLEQLGLAEYVATPTASPRDPQTDNNRTLAVLHDIALRLGYRLLPRQRHTA
jgi:Fe2+ or Zn2+ uptake regulation protein